MPLLPLLAAVSSILTDPAWTARPSGDDMARAYPDKALHQMLDVSGLLTCSVNQAGKLIDCSVIHEAPADLGGAEAILKLAPKFAMKPVAQDGTPVAGRMIKVPIRFMLPAQPMPEMAVPNDKGFEGRVILDCRVTLESRLDNCVLRSAHRSDEGIGMAAIGIAEAINVNPEAPPKPREAFSRVILPIVFTRE